MPADANYDYLIGFGADTKELSSLADQLKKALGKELTVTAKVKVDEGDLRSQIEKIAGKSLTIDTTKATKSLKDIGKAAEDAASKTASAISRMGSDTTRLTRTLLKTDPGIEAYLRKFLEAKKQLRAARQEWNKSSGDITQESPVNQRLTAARKQLEKAKSDVTTYLGSLAKSGKFPSVAKLFESIEKGAPEAAKAYENFVLRLAVANRKLAVQPTVTEAIAAAAAPKKRFARLTDAEKTEKAAAKEAEAQRKEVDTQLRKIDTVRERTKKEAATRASKAESRANKAEGKLQAAQVQKQTQEQRQEQRIQALENQLADVQNRLSQILAAQPAGMGLKEKRTPIGKTGEQEVFTYGRKTGAQTGYAINLPRRAGAKWYDTHGLELEELNKIQQRENQRVASIREAMRKQEKMGLGTTADNLKLAEVKFRGVINIQEANNKALAAAEKERYLLLSTGIAKGSQIVKELDRQIAEYQKRNIAIGRLQGMEAKALTTARQEAVQNWQSKMKERMKAYLGYYVMSRAVWAGWSAISRGFQEAMNVEQMQKFMPAYGGPGFGRPEQNKATQNAVKISVAWGQNLQEIVETQGLWLKQTDQNATMQERLNAAMYMTHLSAMLARVSNTQLADSYDALTAIMKQTGMSVKGVERVLDGLVGLSLHAAAAIKTFGDQSRGAGRDTGGYDNQIKQLLQGLEHAAPMLQQLNIGIKDYAVLITYIAESTALSGQQVASQVNEILATLYKPINIRALRNAKIDIQKNDPFTALTEGAARFIKVFGSVEGKLKWLSLVNQLNFRGQLRTAMIALTTPMSQERARQLKEVYEQSSGALSEQGRKQMDATKGQIDRSNASIQAFTILLSEKLFPTIVSGLTVINTLLLPFLQKTPTAVGALVKIFAMLATSLGIVFVGQKAVAGITALGNALFVKGAASAIGFGASLLKLAAPVVAITLALTSLFAVLKRLSQPNKELIVENISQWERGISGTWGEMMSDLVLRARHVSWEKRWDVLRKEMLPKIYPNKEEAQKAYETIYAAGQPGASKKVEREAKAIFEKLKDTGYDRLINEIMDVNKIKDQMAEISKAMSEPGQTTAYMMDEIQTAVSNALAEMDEKIAKITEETVVYKISLVQAEMEVNKLANAEERLNRLYQDRSLSLRELQERYQLLQQQMAARQEAINRNVEALGAIPGIIKRLGGINVGKVVEAAAAPTIQKHTQAQAAAVQETAKKVKEEARKTITPESPEWPKLSISEAMKRRIALGLTSEYAALPAVDPSKFGKVAIMSIIGKDIDKAVKAGAAWLETTFLGKVETEVGRIPGIGEVTVKPTITVKPTVEIEAPSGRIYGVDDCAVFVKDLLEQRFGVTVKGSLSEIGIPVDLKLGLKAGDIIHLKQAGPGTTGHYAMVSPTGTMYETVKGVRRQDRPVPMERVDWAQRISKVTQEMATMRLATTEGAGWGVSGIGPGTGLDRAKIERLIAQGKSKTANAILAQWQRMEKLQQAIAKDELDNMMDAIEAAEYEGPGIGKRLAEYMLQYTEELRQWRISRVFTRPMEDLSNTIDRLSDDFGFYGKTIERGRAIQDELNRKIQMLTPELERRKGEVTLFGAGLTGMEQIGALQGNPATAITAADERKFMWRPGGPTKAPALKGAKLDEFYRKYFIDAGIDIDALEKALGGEQIQWRMMGHASTRGKFISTLTSRLEEARGKVTEYDKAIIDAIQKIITTSLEAIEWTHEKTQELIDDSLKSLEDNISYLEAFFTNAGVDLRGTEVYRQMLKDQLPKLQATIDDALLKYYDVLNEKWTLEANNQEIPDEVTEAVRKASNDWKAALQNLRLKIVEASFPSKMEELDRQSRQAGQEHALTLRLARYTENPVATRQAAYQTYLQGEMQRRQELVSAANKNIGEYQYMQKTGKLPEGKNEATVVKLFNESTDALKRLNPELDLYTDLVEKLRKSQELYQQLQSAWNETLTGSMDAFSNLGKSISNRLAIELSNKILGPIFQQIALGMAPQNLILVQAVTQTSLQESMDANIAKLANGEPLSKEKTDKEKEKILGEQDIQKWQKYVGAALAGYGIYEAGRATPKGGEIMGGLQGAMAGYQIAGPWGAVAGLGLAIWGMSNRQKDTNEILQKIFDSMPKRSDIQWASPLYLPFSRYAGGGGSRYEIFINIGAGASVNPEATQEAVRRGLNEANQRGLVGRDVYAYV